MTTRLAVIGCGHWGPNHIRVFSQLKDVKVVAAADTDGTRLAAIDQSFPGVRCFSSYREMLCEVSLDAAVVVTPVRTHLDIVTELLENNLHVLCEKPLCTEPDDADRLVELAQSRSRVLMTGHVFLFNPGLLKIKELIDAGTVGAVRYLASARTNLGPIRNDVNAAWDLASHDISIFNWMLGCEPVEVQAMGAAFVQPGIEDVVNINLRYPGGILASVQCSWLDPKKVRQLTVVGSKKMMTWDDLQLSNPVAIYEKTVETDVSVSGYGEFLRLSMLDGDVVLPKVAAGEPLKMQAIEFISAIRSGRRPRSDGSFSVGVVRTLSAIERAISGSRSTPN